MTDTPNLGLPFLEVGQAQKHVTHNEALRMLDVAVQLSVAAVSSSPPGSPAEGERHIVGASPTGAFAGHVNEVAAFQDGAWVFAVPKIGWRAWKASAGVLLVWNGTAWSEFSGGGGGGFDPDNVDHLYINGAAPADPANKLAVRSNDVMFEAVPAAASGTGDVRLQLSKEAAGDTASVFFSKAFSGRAEFGLVGGDAFKLKVSSDGSSWTESMVFDHATGKVSFPQGISGTRERLSANRTYYVRADGSDSNTGLVDSAGGAFLTIQKAWDVIVTLDLGGFVATIQIGDGTYTGALNATVPPVGGTVVINGNSGTPANVIVSTTGRTVSVGCSSRVTLQNFEIRSSASYGVEASNGALVIIGAGMRFGACGASHLRAIGTGYIFGASAYTISGASAIHYLAAQGGAIELATQTVTVSGTPAFGDAFAKVDVAGIISAFSVTFSGGATGTRYKATLNGVINTFGGGANYFPGNAAGSTATGGQYA